METQTEIEWAGPDSDRRPSARQADVLTRLDDRPTCCVAYQISPLVLIYFLFQASNAEPQNIAFITVVLRDDSVIVLSGLGLWQTTKC